jgi:ABC-type amino acid transport substrate-binding protein
MRLARLPLSAPIAALLAAGAMLALTALTAVASPTLDRIRQGGTMTFAYRDGAAPFSFKDRESRVRGYSVELCVRVATAIQKELELPELKIEWVPVDATTRFDAVASGKVDVECGTTTMTLSRMKTVDFSVPIFVDGGSVLVRAKSKLARLDDFKGKRIAVIAGTTTEMTLARTLVRIGARATLVQVKTPAEGMAALMQGRADGYAGDRIVLASLRSRAADPAQLAFIGNDFSYEPYALMMRRDDPDFRLAVNRALAALYRSGDIDPIFQRWLAPLGLPGPLLHAMYYLNTLPE